MGIPYSLGSSNNYKGTSCMKWLYTLEVDFLVFMRLLTVELSTILLL